MDLATIQLQATPSYLCTSVIAKPALTVNRLCDKCFRLYEQQDGLWDHIFPPVVFKTIERQNSGSAFILQMPFLVKCTHCTLLHMYLLGLR